MLEDLISDKTFVAFDLETTGIHTAIHRIVEIGAVKFHWEHGIIDEYETLVNPERSMPPEVIKVHGITDQMVKDQPLLKECLPEFLSFISDSILLAHNAPFDLGFISYAMNALELEQPENLVIDTCSLSRSLIKNTPNHKLQTLVQMLKLENLQAHRAKTDSIACLEVFKYCVEKLPSGKQTALNEIFSKSPRARSAFFGPQEPDAEFKDLTTRISQAISNNLDLEIQYHNAKNERLKRKITPIYLGGYGKQIYLEAFCHLRQARRHFKINRIQNVIS